MRNDCGPTRAGSEAAGAPEDREADSDETESFMDDGRVRPERDEGVS